MIKTGLKSPSYLGALVAIMMAVTPVVDAVEPPGVRDLLKTAVAAEDRDSFDRILRLAFQTWPGDKTDILIIAEELRPDWLLDEQQQSLANFRAAQIAVEEKEKARGIWYYLDPKYWSPRIELGAGTASGDTNEQSLHLGFTANRDFEKWSHSLNVNVDYAERQSVVTRERYDLISESLWKVFNKGGISNFTQVEFDSFSGFDWRVTEVIGVSFDVIKNKRHSLRLTGGPGFRFSRVESSVNDGVFSPAFTQQGIIGRIGANYKLDLGGGLTFSDNLSAVGGAGSFRLDNGAILSAKINASLAARLRFDVVYESDVPVGTSEVDTVTRATIVYTF